MIKLINKFNCKKEDPFVNTLINNNGNSSVIKYKNKIYYGEIELNYDEKNKDKLNSININNKEYTPSIANFLLGMVLIFPLFYEAGKCMENIKNIKINNNTDNDIKEIYICNNMEKCRKMYHLLNLESEIKNLY